MSEHSDGLEESGENTVQTTFTFECPRFKQDRAATVHKSSCNVSYSRPTMEHGLFCCAAKGSVMAPFCLGSLVCGV